MPQLFSSFVVSLEDPTFGSFEEFGGVLDEQEELDSIGEGKREKKECSVFFWENVFVFDHRSIR
jgi:hypothetical protein